jgi:hypothetical protein
MIFNPIRTRESLLEFGLGYVRDETFDPAKPVGNIACSDFIFLINAWLAGLETELTPIVPRALEWLNFALEHNEEMGESINFHRRNLLWVKGVGSWMKDGTSDLSIWKEACAVDAELLAEKNVWQKGNVATDRLNEYMAFAYQAERFGEAISEYEKYHGAKKPSLSGVLSPRKLGYAHCLQALHACFDPQDLLKAGQRLLDDKLEDDWLGRGEQVRAVTWLKIIYWHHNPSLTPLQTILKAYDHMPNVPRPWWVAG